MTRPDRDYALVAALGEGLAGRWRDLALIERRLADFAFVPEAREEGGTKRGDSLGGDEAARSGAARDLVLRALAAAADPVNQRLLRELAGPEAVSLAALAEALGLLPLAVRERVSDLARLALAGHDLERDAATPTPAGHAMLALVEGATEALAARLAALRPGPGPA